MYEAGPGRNISGMMKIVVDENIPCAEQLFGGLGSVVYTAGRSVSPEVVADAEVLLVRSVTAVGADLLEGSAVRFVGTATIGTDHIDLAYLAGRGITFADAAGSNSNSVAEYVIVALLVIAERAGLDLAGKSIGVIGVGNVGSKVKAKAAALGLRVLANDPPLQRETNDPDFVSLDTVLDEADIVTCHVPLTRKGLDPTWHLLDRERLGRLGPERILLNTARGGVVDNVALKEALQKNRLGPTVLDVWEGEPNIDVGLLGEVGLGTPHIAGYSLDGKVNGTVMLYEAVCEFLGEPAERTTSSTQGRTSEAGRRDTHALAARKHATRTTAELLGEAPVPRIELDSSSGSEQELLRRAMTGIYDIEGDDRDLRGLAKQGADGRGKYFDRLRKEYGVRREAAHTQVRLAPYRAGLAEKLRALGFPVVQE